MGHLTMRVCTQGGQPIQEACGRDFFGDSESDGLPDTAESTER